MVSFSQVSPPKTCIRLSSHLYALHAPPILLDLMTPKTLGEKIEKNEMAGHVARVGERRDVYRVLMGKPEGKRPLGRPSRRWEDNIMMYLQEVVWRDMDWIDVAQGRDRWRVLLNAVMNIWVP